jgi:hypothetical protein
MSSGSSLQECLREKNISSVDFSLVNLEVFRGITAYLVVADPLKVDLLAPNIALLQY